MAARGAGAASRAGVLGARNRTSMRNAAAVNHGRADRTGSTMGRLRLKDCECERVFEGFIVHDPFDGNNRSERFFLVL
jgi:hypothetical protein